MTRALARLAPSMLVLLSACAGDATESDPKPPFRLVFEGLSGALISVSGSAPDDVWAVGADTRDGDGALVLHFDGEGWRREPTGQDANLWWVHVQRADSVWMGGESGTILHYDGERFERVDTPGSSTVFGIWGASEDELWAVGGEPEVAPGFVWRYDGRAWADATSLLPDAARGPSLYKVWGRRADDVWLVGAEGTALHWDGEAFERADAGTDRDLFTVHGAASGAPRFAAVGGYGDGVIVEHAGTSWHAVTPSPPPFQLFGVHLIGPDGGYAVGQEATIVQKSGAAWELLDTGFELFDPLHAVWVDPDGGVWAVGGNIQSSAPDRGMLLHRGEVIENAIDE